MAALCARAQIGIGTSGVVATIGAPLGSDSQFANALLIGTESSFSYDNNALNSTPTQSDFIAAIYPHLALNVTRQRLGATLTYIPGLTYSSANIPSYDLMSQALGATFSYRLTQRLTLDMRESFSSSSNPFDSLRNSSLLPQFGVLNTPTAVSWNLIPKTIEIAEADSTYKFTGRTSGYVRLAYEYLDYQQAVGSSHLVDLSQQSTSQLMSFGLGHQLSLRSTTGVQFTSQVLDFGRGTVRTTAETLAYEFQRSITPSIVVSALVGPQYLDTRQSLLSGEAATVGLPTQSVCMWSWMGGATISWTVKHNGLFASAVRQIGTGIGLQGNVRQTIISFQAQHKIGKRSALDVFTSYNMNEPLIQNRLNVGSSNSYLSAGGEFSRNLTDRWTLRCTVWAIRQGAGSNADPQYSGNHNRAAISLSYQLTKPLRRG
jgi:hypothetical protein